MTYVKDSLLKDEQVLYYTKPHYIVFYTVFVWLALALFIFKIGASLLMEGVIIVMGIGSFIGDFISYRYTEYAITNKRVIMKVGFIQRRSLEIFLDRVEGIYVNQGITGRIFNFGTVVIVGVGGTKNPFFFIADPLKFRSSVQQQLHDGGK